MTMHHYGRAPKQPRASLKFRNMHTTMATAYLVDAMLAYHVYGNAEDGKNKLMAARRHIMLASAPIPRASFWRRWLGLQ